MIAVSIEEFDQNRRYKLHLEERLWWKKERVPQGWRDQKRRADECKGSVGVKETQRDKGRAALSAQWIYQQ